MQNSALISANLTEFDCFGLVLGHIRLTLTIPKCNVQYANNEESLSATLTAEHPQSCKDLDR